MRLIDADKLEKQFQNLVKSRSGTLGGPIYAAALERVQNAPTVSIEDGVAVVHARWKCRRYNIAVCTNCSFARDMYEDFGAAVSCPNCGAKMDQEVAKK